MIRMRFAALAAAMLVAGVGPATADTLVDNVDGATLDAQGKPLRFTALLIDNEGRIAKLLARKDKRPKKPDYLVDGKGKFVLPGMIDAHLRLMPTALSLLAPNHEGKLPAPRAEDRDVAFAKLQRLLAAQGYTAVADMTTTIEDWQTYRRAGDNGTLYLRVMAYAPDIAAMTLIAGPRPTPWLYGDRLRLNGLHLSLTGAPYNDTQLRNVMSRAAMDGFQVALSATDAKQVARALAAFAELAGTYKGDRRWRIEQLNAADMADFAAYKVEGVTVTTAPDALGSAPSPAQPWRSLLAAKVPVAFGTADGRTTASPLARLASGWQSAERLTRDEALAALTSDAARAGFAEGRFGKLAEGERADFILLDRDPQLASPAELRQMRVLETWVGGRKIYDAATAARQATSGSGQALTGSAAGSAPAAPAAMPPALLPPPASSSPASR